VRKGEGIAGKQRGGDGGREEGREWMEGRKRRRNRRRDCFEDFTAVSIVPALIFIC